MHCHTCPGFAFILQFDDFGWHTLFCDDVSAASLNLTQPRTILRNPDSDCSTAPHYTHTARAALAALGCIPSQIFGTCRVRASAHVRGGLGRSLENGDGYREAGELPMLVWKNASVRVLVVLSLRPVMRSAVALGFPPRT